MFVVYDKMTNIVLTENEVPHIKLVKISMRDDNIMILQSINDEMLTLNIAEIMITRYAKTCNMSFSSELLVKVNILDCGTVVANWLNRCVNI